MHALPSSFPSPDLPPQHASLQYTSLIHFLASGYYQNPYDDGNKSVTNINHWPKRLYPQLYKGVMDLVSRFGDGR
jgi:hypothetical protein